MTGVSKSKKKKKKTQTLEHFLVLKQYQSY